MNKLGLAYVIQEAALQRRDTARSIMASQVDRGEVYNRYILAQWEAELAELARKRLATV